jgi:aminoglycoside/choline kinase family phosphotransferase
MNTGLILQRASQFLPHPGHPETRVEPIERGGSDRSFFRVQGPASATRPGSIIVVRYGSERAENQHYVGIARFLADIGVRVPQIFFHDEEARLIGMEDLGERDLWSFRDEPWERLCALYQHTLDQAALLHSRAHRALNTASGPCLQKEFDAALYLWEQDYFFENCLGRQLGIDVACFDRAPLHSIAERLAALPRVLVHRDFQSQNVMISEGTAFLIDFQGLRPGLPHYDVASLVFDPYVALPPARRRELVEYYQSAAQAAQVPLAGDFSETLALCAMQRLMQALGAYGFLGIVKGRAQFLGHTPAALRLLREVAAAVPDLGGLPRLLDHPAILAMLEKMED